MRHKSTWRQPYVIGAFFTGFAMSLGVAFTTSALAIKSYEAPLGEIDLALHHANAPVQASEIDFILNETKDHIIEDVVQGPTQVNYDGNILDAPLQILATKIPVGDVAKTWPHLDDAQKQLIDLVAEDFFNNNLSNMQRLRITMANVKHGEAVAAPIYQNLSDTQKAIFRRHGLNQLNDTVLEKSGPSNSNSII